MVEKSTVPEIHQKVGRLGIRVYSNRSEMGLAAAADVVNRMHEMLSEKDTINMVFAAAPSQNEFLDEICRTAHLDWNRVNAFHLDEYIGLPAGAPQRFGKFLSEHIFDRVKPGKVHYLDGNAVDIATECERYAKLLEEHPLDIACIGVGENGHIAFNDPPVADFDDPKAVKVVGLEERCRRQQVHDGCFPSMDRVPTHAITVTIPAIMAARHIYCMVPGSTKSTAIAQMLKGDISTECPSSILRTHDSAILYLDKDAASEL